MSAIFCDAQIAPVITHFCRKGTLNLYSYCGNDPINHIDPDGLFFKKLFGWIGKAFKFLFKVAAVALFVVAMVLLPGVAAAGGAAWLGWLGLMGIAGAAGLAGWHNGKLGQIAGLSLTVGAPWNANDRLFRTPSINPGAVEQHLLPQSGGRGGGKGRVSGGSGGRYNGPPRSRFEAWARIWRDILTQRKQAPRPPKRLYQLYGYVKHHIFPQEFASQFSRAGVNVHEATVMIPEHIHRGIHPGWNYEWKSFFNRTPNPTRTQIYNFGNTLMRRQGLDTYGIVQYQ